VAKLRTTLNDDESLVFDLQAKWETLGITLTDWSKELPEDLLIHDIGGFHFSLEPGGLLFNLLGPNVIRVSAAAIVRVDDKNFQRYQDLLAYLENERAGAFVKTTFCVHKETVLQLAKNHPPIRTMGEYRNDTKLLRSPSHSAQHDRPAQKLQAGKRSILMAWFLIFSAQSAISAFQLPETVLR